MLIYLFACCKDKSIDKISKLKTINFLSDNSLECYVGALPAQIIFTEFMLKYDLNNILVFAIVFLMNILFAILLKMYTAKSKLFIKKYGLCNSLLAFAGVMLISIVVKMIYVYVIR